jgi:hypothetical protein
VAAEGYSGNRSYFHIKNVGRTAGKTKNLAVIDWLKDLHETTEAKIESVINSNYKTLHTSPLLGKD